MRATYSALDDSRGQALGCLDAHLSQLTCPRTGGRPWRAGVARPPSGPRADAANSVGAHSGADLLVRACCTASTALLGQPVPLVASLRGLRDRRRSTFVRRHCSPGFYVASPSPHFGCWEVVRSDVACGLDDGMCFSRAARIRRRPFRVGRSKCAISPTNDESVSATNAPRAFTESVPPSLLTRSSQI